MRKELIKFYFLSLFQVDKRAHHNALERKRRDHIKDSFSGLRDSVPSLQGEKVKYQQNVLMNFTDFLFLIKQKFRMGLASRLAGLRF